MDIYMDIYMNIYLNLQYSPYSMDPQEEYCSLQPLNLPKLGQYPPEQEENPPLKNSNPQYYLNNQQYQQLGQLSYKLYFKSCLLSVVFMLLLASLVIGAHHYMLIQYRNIQRNGGDGPDTRILLFQSIRQSIGEILGYVKFVAQLTDTIVKDYKINRVKQQTLQAYNNKISLQSINQISRTKFYNTTGSLQCIKNNQQSLCSVLSPLSQLVWQYSQRKSINNILESIIICGNITLTNMESDNYGCVGTPLSKSKLQSRVRQYVQQNTDMCTQQYMNNLFVVDADLNESSAIIGYFSIIQLPTQSLPILLLTKLSISSLFLQNSKNLQHFNSNSQQFRYMQLKISSNISAHQHQQYTFQSCNQMDLIAIPFENIVKYSEKLVDGSLVIDFGYEYELVIQKVGWRLETGLFCLLFGVYILFFEIRNIKVCIYDMLYRKELLNKMYKLAIKQIFLGNKPIQSFVLKKGPLGSFFYQLSQLIDRSMVPITSEKKAELKRKPFKFKNKTCNLVDKYKEIISNLMSIKNKEILNNRFSIQSFVNSLCEKQAEQLKQYYTKALQANILLQFFKFGYIAILRSPEKYAKFLKKDISPIPKQLIMYFAKVNHQLHQIDLMRETIQLQILKNVYAIEETDEQPKIQIQRNNKIPSQAAFTTNNVISSISKKNIKQLNSSEYNDQVTNPSHIEILKKGSNKDYTQNHKNKDRPKYIRDQVNSDQSGEEVVIFSNSTHTRIHDKSSRRNKNKSKQDNSLQSNDKQNQYNWQEQETKDQLQIRIRVFLIPKYLAMFKDLDLENQYAKKLGLQKQLINLSKILDNTRYLLTRHNKNIRIFSKSL